MLLCVFLFKLNTNSFIRTIHYNICMLISQNIRFMKCVNWERKSNFKHGAHGTNEITIDAGRSNAMLVDRTWRDKTNDTPHSLFQGV